MASLRLLRQEWEEGTTPILEVVRIDPRAPEYRVLIVVLQVTKEGGADYLVHRYFPSLKPGEWHVSVDFPRGSENAGWPEALAFVSGMFKEYMPQEEM